MLILYSYFFFKVFHKIITNGHQRLQPLFDCLLTIIVNGKSLLRIAIPDRAYLDHNHLHINNKHCNSSSFHLKLLRVLT